MFFNYEKSFQVKLLSLQSGDIMMRGRRSEREREREREIEREGEREGEREKIEEEEYVKKIPGASRPTEQLTTWSGRE